MKNKKVYGLVGVAALAAVGGTFAYYSATQTFSNPFNTTNYGTQATEKFNPKDGDGWEPGGKVDKDVYATNTGKGDVWVRVKFDEIWKLKVARKDADGKLVMDENGNPVIDVREMTRSALTPTDNFDIVKPADAAANWVPTAGDHQENSEDGQTTNDSGSVVYKEYVNPVSDIDDAGEGWYKAGDGYFYYNIALEEGKSSAKLLDSVTLAKDTDMGHFIGEYAYLVAAKGQYTDEKNNIPVYPKPEGEWRPAATQFDLPVIPTKPEELKADASDEEKEKYEKDLEVYTTGVANWKAKWTENELKKLEGKDVFTYKANKLDMSAQGYANADYNLNITVEFVQTDAEAAKGLGWNTEVVTKLADKLAAKKAATTTTP